MSLLQNYKLSMRIFSFVFLLLATYYLLPTQIFAAEFALGRGDVQPDGTRDVAVLLHTGSSVNAIEGTINIGENVTVVSTNDAGSIVAFWIEKPNKGESGSELSFAGIIPGGFIGEGVVLHLLVRGDSAGLSINKNKSQTLLNDGAGTKDVVKISPTKPLPPQLGLRLSSTSDTTTPRAFTPIIGDVPIEEGTEQAVVFATRDGESGVLRYEIAYADSLVDPSDASLVWRISASPSVLLRDSHSKFIYVKAVDYAGNAHVEVLPYPGSAQLSFNSLLYFGILGGGAIVAGIFFWFIRRRKYVSKIS